MDNESIKLARQHHRLAYNSWVAMHQRVNNTKSKDYKYCGAKGITICYRWYIFDYFLEDMGDPPIDKETYRRYTLDRKNNNGNYELSNCRWTTDLEQNSNRSCKNRAIRVTEL